MKFAIVALLTLTGCIHSSSMTIRAADGSLNIGVRCSRTNYCLQEAGNQCPSGYDLIERDKGSMVIKCHGKSKYDLEQLDIPTSHNPYYPQEIGLPGNQDNPGRQTIHVLTTDQDVSPIHNQGVPIP